jgi:hypothetical protein
MERTERGEIDTIRKQWSSHLLASLSSFLLFSSLALSLQLSRVSCDRFTALCPLDATVHYTTL